MPIETVRIELLGSAFTIQTDERREYVESLIRRLRDRFEEVSASTGVDEPLKLALLAGLYMADELERAGMGESPALREAGAVAERLIARIDDILE